MKRITIFCFIIIATTSLACGFLSPQKSGGDVWPTPIVSTEQAKQLQDNLKAANDQLAANQNIDLVITESQLTSLVVQELDNQGITVIKNPQIYLRDGKVQTFAKYVEGSAEIDIQIILSFTAQNGKIAVTLEGVKLAGFTAPQLLMSQIQDAVRTNVEPLVNERLSTDLFIDSLTIENGNLTLKGHKP